MHEKQISIADIAKLTSSKVVGDEKHMITNVSDLESAGPDDASFLSNPRYEQAMRSSKAGVVFVDQKASLINGRNFLIHENPSEAFQKLIELFYGTEEHKSHFTGIHPSAIIDASAQLGKNVTIGPHAVIEKDAVIGDNSFIGAGCYIGNKSTLGKDCYLYPNVTIRERCVIGNRVILQPGVVIGSCGFGYITDKTGKHIKLNQVGNVIIEDDVEIGANTTIDRARFKSTRIGRGSKIDNLVQIGHGVVIGEGNIIVSQTGIAGSSQTGKYVIIAGQCAVAGHLKICDGAIIAGRAGVSKSITKPGKYGGLPAIALDEHNRNVVFQRNIESYVKEIKSLCKRVEALEGKGM